MRSWPRTLAPLAVGVLIYLGLRLAFASATADEGLIDPDGAPDLGVLALGLAFLLVRVWLILALPAVLVMRLAARLREPRA